MKFKIIFGIALPLLVVVLLVVLTSMNIGFSVKKDFINSVNFKEVFVSDYSSGTTFKIAEIIVENDYFLGKRYDLPNFGICFDDKEGKRERLNAGNLQYNEGDYNYEKGGFVYGKEMMAYPYYGRGYRESRNIEIGANGKKSIRLFLQPSYNYRYGGNYSEILEQYGDYDSLLIFELKDEQGYYYCSQIDQGTLEGAVAISITK